MSLRLFFILVIAVFSGGTIFATEPPKIGDVLFQRKFEDRDSFKDARLSYPGIGIVEAGGRDGLEIKVPNGQKYASAVFKLDPENFRGTRLKITGAIKADNIPKPPHSYNGLKLMLHFKAPSVGERWLQENDIYGTFDWKEAGFIAECPPDITEMELILGIENTTGSAWFGDVKISVIGLKRSPEAFKFQKVYKGHDLPRLRGAMISPDNFNEEDIAFLAGKWKANHVRWQLIWSGFPNGPADSASIEEYEQWLEKQLKHLDEMLPLCEKYGVHVVIDVHTPPGGRLPRETGSAMRLFLDEKFQEAFMRSWEKIAERYKNQPNIWGYDLLNEPVEGKRPENIPDWRTLALETSKRIRKIDPNRAIIIEPAPWGAPDALDWFEPFDPQEVPNVVYSVHMYIPHAFTHQGVYESKDVLSYPGTVQGKHWDKDSLRKALDPVRSFQLDYGVHIYLGEFSVIRWAPGESGANYLRDVIELFEEYEWDWAYHAFREWDGWSLEHGSDKNDRKKSEATTDRAEIVRKWFEKNQ